MGNFTIFLLISSILACTYALSVSIWIILAVRRRKRGEKDFKYIPLYENDIVVNKLNITETKITIDSVEFSNEEDVRKVKVKKDDKPKTILHFKEKEISPYPQLV